MGAVGKFGFGGNVSNFISGLTYKGTWDALLNSPFLASGVGTAGDYYIVSVAGTTNLDGITDWQVGDWAIFEGGVWQKVDNHDIQCYSTIQNEGVSLPQQPILDFQGDGVDVTNGAGKTIVTIPSFPPTINYGLFAQTSLSTPITATISELSLIGSGVGTLSVPANTFKVGDSFVAKICGKISCANSETLQIRVKSGVDILADSGLIDLKIATNKNYEIVIDFTVTKIGINGVAELFTNGIFTYNRNADDVIAGDNFALINNTTFNTTILNNLSITAQWGSANPNNSIQSQNFVLNKTF
jgi:hypothetical protein